MCGFRPTGRLHLGHYFSVIKPGQDGATVLIANYHAPHETHDPTEVLAKFGIQNIILQTEVFNARFYFELLSVASMGELERMTQYKSKDDKNAHLLTYPVLMTHDVAGYEEVLVGEDQKQHLQYARHLLNKYNRIFKQNIRIPVENVVVGRIKDLKNPERKMSKSEPAGCLFLDDTPDAIRGKIRKAVPLGEGKANLDFLYSEFVGEEIPAMNSELKENLSEALISRFCN